MSADEATVEEHLSRIRNTEIQLRQYVPNELVDGFSKAIFSLAPSTEIEKAILFSPLANYLASIIAKQDADNTSVRIDGAIPRSIIASATMDMIDNLGGSISKVPTLREILIRLLEIKSYSNKQSRQHAFRFTAILILSLKPETGANQLSKLVGVSSSTVSRWKKDADFIEELTLVKKMTLPVVRLAIIGATNNNSEVRKYIEA
tara:strand:+ start:178 stop:789 length:612 start_codon:yes stop_codon:yes gene_type:complete